MSARIIHAKQLSINQSMRAAIYARMSTSDQHNEIQIHEVTEYVTRRGWESAGVYQDQMREKADCTNARSRVIRRRVGKAITEDLCHRSSASTP